jgi:hypothetical protein
MMMRRRKVTNLRMMIAGSALALLWVVSGASAQDATQEKSYPVRSKVISAHVGGEAVGSAGIVGTIKRWIFRVDCGDLYYDLQGKGKPTLTIGQDIDFRIEKQKAYMKGENNKETKFPIVGMGKPDPKPKSD